MTRISWAWLMGKQDSNMADFFMKLLSLFEYGIRITNLDAGAGHVPEFLAGREIRDVFT
jgi:hypothetical protein